MRTVKMKKQNYLRPTISVCSIVEESFILVASPNVRPGGDNGGNVQVIDLIPDVGDNDDELVG
nr:hypothetical protein [uncultured Prevotella sp.]